MSGNKHNQTHNNYTNNDFHGVGVGKEIKKKGGIDREMETKVLFCWTYRRTKFPYIETSTVANSNIVIHTTYAAS